MTNSANALQVKEAYHYVNARINQSTAEKLTLLNNDAEVISKIEVTIDNPEITLENHCASGLLPNKSCQIIYNFSPKKQISSDEKGVQSKKNHLKITYFTAKQQSTLDFYIVSTQMDRLKIIGFPASFSHIHDLPSIDIRGMSYDEYNRELFVTTPAGLSLSTDFGKTWQTLSMDLLSPFLSYNNRQYPALDSVYAYRGRIYLSAKPANGLFVSEDHGATWSKVHNFKQVNEIAVNNNILYVAHEEGISLSKDDGKTWVTSLDDSISALAFGILNGKKIMLAAPSISKELHLSEDGGYTWRKISTTFCDPFSCNFGKGIGIHQNAIYIVSFTSTLAKTKDEGQTWEPITTISAANTDYFLFTDKIIFTRYKTSFDGGKTWQERNGDISLAGKLKMIHANLENNAPTLLISSSLGINKSLDEGEHFTKISPEKDYSRWWFKVGGDTSSNRFILGTYGSVFLQGENNHLNKVLESIFNENSFNPFMVHQDDIYTIGEINHQLYYSTDFGKTWQQRKLLYSSIIINRDPLALIAHYTTGPQHDDKYIHISQDLGLTWQDIPFAPQISQQSYCHFTPYLAKTHYYAVGKCDEPWARGFYIRQSDHTWKIVFNDSYIYFYNDVFVKDDDIYLITKDRNEKNTLRISHDAGNTWQSIKLNFKAITLLGVVGGVIYLTENNYLFNPNSLFLSIDEGQHWQKVGLLNFAFTKETSSGFPSMTVLKDNILINADSGLFMIGK